MPEQDEEEFTVSLNIRRATGKISDENLSNFIKKIFNDIFAEEIVQNVFIQPEQHVGPIVYSRIILVINEEPEEMGQEASMEIYNDFYAKLSVLFRKLNLKYTESGLGLNISTTNTFITDDEFTNT